MKRQSQSYREEICWSWKSVHVWWRIIKWVKDGTQMHEKHEPEEVSQQHVCKLRLRSRWKEWGKCWLANAGKQMGIFRSVLPAGYQVLDQICTVHRCVELVLIFNSAYHLSTATHRRNHYQLLLCNRWHITHLRRKNFSWFKADLQVSRCTSTQAQSGRNANLWCESEACSISQNQNIFK